MFGVAAFGGRIERRAARYLFCRIRDHLCAVALAGLSCGVAGAFIAPQVRSGSNLVLALCSRIRVQPLAASDSAGALFNELPQLINSCPGHMPLARPRPALPDEAGKYAEHVRRRLMSKPGLTGLWQGSALVRRSGPY
jgi:hypothetical protein